MFTMFDRNQFEASGVNFINVFTYEFFVQTLFLQLFLVTFWLWQKIRMKNARENVDEIDRSSLN